jgi:hypothetical protein
MSLQASWKHHPERAAELTSTAPERCCYWLRWHVDDHSLAPGFTEIPKLHSSLLDRIYRDFSLLKQVLMEIGGGVDYTVL